MKVLKISFHIFLIIFLTIISQIGGIVYILALIFKRKHDLNRATFLGAFISAYLLTALFVVPRISPFFDRYPLPIDNQLHPSNYMTCILNRHYVERPLRDVLINTSRKLARNGSNQSIQYLDANFPFFNFPMLPHLSHSDGRKVDLAFQYLRNGEESNSSPSVFGYGVFESAKSNEVNYADICESKGFWQYSALVEYLPKWNSAEYKVDVQNTSLLIKALAESKAISKIFLEPHLKSRWNLSQYDKIRFHGCHAVRHDDHIHIQL